jgi:tetratricopeptide (TPR) repeat protein
VRGLSCAANPAPNIRTRRGALPTSPSCFRLKATIGARPLCERALAIREKALGPDHPHTALSLNLLANLLWSQGDLADARPICERALAICKKALGSDHPDTGTTLHTLVLVLHDQGDLAAAQPLCERALAIREKVLGPEHPVIEGDLEVDDGGGTYGRGHVRRGRRATPACVMSERASASGRG